MVSEQFKIQLVQLIKKGYKNDVVDVSKFPYFNETAISILQDVDSVAGFIMQLKGCNVLTEEICLAAAKLDGQSIRFMDNKFRTPDVCLAAVQNDPFVITHLKNNQVTQEIYDIAKKCPALERVLRDITPYCPTPNGVADDLSVRILVGAQYAYACITTPSTTMDVRLNGGKSAQASLNESAKELREKIARYSKQMALMEAAAMLLDAQDEQKRKMDKKISSLSM